MTTGSAVIELRGLRCLCRCGALPEEQDRPQPYEFDLDVVADLPALASDRLEDTIDYGAVLDRVVAVTEGESFMLFERMAQRVVDEVLDDSRVEEVTVVIRKLRPPVPYDVGSAGIRLVGRRGG